MEETKMDSTGAPQAASKTWIAAFGTYLIVFNLMLLYIVLRMWPGQVPMKADPIHVIIIPNLFELSLWSEARYLALVALVGALGSYIHLATSFADYLGNRQFVKSWEWWYGLRPFIGAALAVIVYFAARGGLVSGTTGAESLSPYGICALAGLTGMFSKQATDKLREVFENLFKTDPTHRADPLQGPTSQPQKSSP